MDNEKYISFYAPTNIYIPFDNVDKLKLRKNRQVYLKEIIGSMNNGQNIFSFVSGIIKGSSQLSFENKIYNCLVIENDYRDKQFKLSGGKEKIDVYKRKETNELLEIFNIRGKYNGKKYLAIDLKVSKNHLENRFICEEKAFEILETIDALITIYNLEGGYIITNDEYSLEILKRYSGMYLNIKFGKLKENDNTVIYNGNELLKLYYILKYNEKVTEKFVTIVNKKEIKIVKTKVNILISELLLYMNISYSNICIITYDEEKIENYNGILTENVKTIIIS